jgi:hypothetical protein
MLPVNRILLVNPENFFWHEGTRLDELQLADVVSSAWKRPLIGAILTTKVAGASPAAKNSAQMQAQEPWGGFLRPHAVCRD